MNLEAWLKQDRSLPDQLNVMEGICDALNEAHGRGVLHRALEPFNIETDGEGAADLRGAVNADASTAAAAARYRAPEVPLVPESIEVGHAHPGPVGPRGNTCWCAGRMPRCRQAGAVFLAMSLLFKNPIVPAVVLLFWEGINGVLPVWLKRLSVTYYLKPLFPVDLPARPARSRVGPRS